MRVTIIKPDSIVIVDGRVFVVDLSEMESSIHAVQWDGVAGHIERQGMPNETITSISEFSIFLARWESKRAADDIPHVPTQDEIIQSFKDAIQALLDNAAIAKGYDDIVSACSYAGYPNVFQTEAIAFGTWRANIWAYGYGEMAKVIAGTRPMPTVETILAELPGLVLP